MFYIFLGVHGGFAWVEGLVLREFMVGREVISNEEVIAAEFGHWGFGLEPVYFMSACCVFQEFFGGNLHHELSKKWKNELETNAKNNCSSTSDSSSVHREDKRMLAVKMQRLVQYHSI